MRILLLWSLLALLPQPATAGGAGGFLSPQRVGPQVSGDGAIADQLGADMAAQGNTLVVGARQVVLPSPSVPEGVQSGAVFVYTDGGTGIVAGQRLGVVDGGESDLFGAALALDGDLLAVGAPGADREGVFNRGLVYLFRRSGATWSLETTLSAPAPADDDNFGLAVVLDAGTVIIGAPGRMVGAMGSAGMAFGYRQLAGTWTLTASLQAATPATGDRFGTALALSGDRLLVGVPQADAAGPIDDAGAVEVFSVGATITAIARLTEPAPAPRSRFGAALWLDSNDAVVGAPGDFATSQGFARAYTRVGGALIEGNRLLAADGAPADGFGAAFALDAGTLLVGAPSRVFGQGGGYVFRRQAGVWTQRARLEDFSSPGDVTLTGNAVAFFGGRAMLGADLASVGANRAQGRVLVWQGADALWTQQSSVDRGDGAAGDFFGFSVSIDGSRMAVGSFLQDTLAGGDDAGAVSMFLRSGTGWVREAEIVAPDGEPEDWFGRAVAVAGDVLVVGAPRDIVGSGSAANDCGSVSIFERQGAGSWSFARKLVAPTCIADDAFGFALVFDGVRLLVAAPGRNDGELDRGAAFAWTRLVSGDWRYDGALVPSTVSAGGLAGIGISMAGNRAALGAPEAAVGLAAKQGIVVLFNWNGSAWIEGETVLAADGAASNRFGGSVALDTTSAGLAVGAAGVGDGASVPSHGAAYVYRLGGPAAVQQARVTAPIIEAGAGLGVAVALRDGRLLVGASGEDSGGITDRGRVYIWREDNGAWLPHGMLDPTQATPFTFFGRSLSADFGVLAVAGPLRAAAGPAEGSVWIYQDADRLFADSFD